MPSFTPKLLGVIGVSNEFSNVICSSLTPLHVASEKSHLDAMELLIKGGAKVRDICFCLTMISHLVLERLDFI